MSLVQYCSTCNSKIISKSEQFRSDDEPSTLVSMCPVHGTIGSLFKLYLESSNKVVVTTSSKLQRSHTLGSPTYVINRNSTESYIDNCEYYMIRVDISDPKVPYMTSTKHVSVKTSCVIHGKSYLCTRHFSHPLCNHCKGYEDGIGTVIESKNTLGPFLVTKIRVLVGVTIDIHTKDLPIVDCEYAMMYDDGHSISVCYKNEDAHHFSIMILSSTHSNLIQVLHGTYGMLSDAHTRLHTESFQYSWLFQILSSSNIFDETILYVRRDVKQGNEDGKFISTYSTPSIAYINNQLCIIIYIKNRECILFDMKMTGTDPQLFGVFKSYVRKDHMYTDRSLLTESCSVDSIVTKSESISEVDRTHSTHWTEFIPTCCESIVVRPYNERYVIQDVDFRFSIRCMMRIRASEIDRVSTRRSAQ